MPVTVDFAAPAAEVYAHLADPASRPAWQASLKRIEHLSGDGGVGTTWTDVTVVGARPRMRVVEVEPGRVWAESGRWRGIEATLRLELTATTTTTTSVRATFGFSTPLLLRPVGWALSVLAPQAVRGDLRRAARKMREMP